MGRAIAARLDEGGAKVVVDREPDTLDILAKHVQSAAVIVADVSELYQHGVGRRPEALPRHRARPRTPRPRAAYRPDQARGHRADRARHRGQRHRSGRSADRRRDRGLGADKHPAYGQIPLTTTSVKEGQLNQPIDQHPLRDDPVTAGAWHEIINGRRSLLAVSDGFLKFPPNFIGTKNHPHALYDLMVQEHGEPRMPLGCFLFRGERTVLIDTGFGPHDYANMGAMIGGRLLAHLEEACVRPEDIDVVALSHLHMDHVGWVGDVNGEPVFPNATVTVGAGDWDHFIRAANLEDPSAPPEHIVAALRQLEAQGRVELIAEETEIDPGLQRISAPGHTPGHSVYIINDGTKKVFLLGDAMYCPQQLTNTDWEALSDTDPVLARQTREQLAIDIDTHGAEGLGCHFPGLVGGRVLSRPTDD
jgi:glyoxylase-like metal-dependent hydrolase (beta-lactamase superfamily II)